MEKYPFFHAFTVFLGFKWTFISYNITFGNRELKLKNHNPSVHKISIHRCVNMILIFYYDLATKPSPPIRHNACTWKLKITSIWMNIKKYWKIREIQLSWLCRTNVKLYPHVVKRAYGVHEVCHLQKSRTGSFQCSAAWKKGI